MLSMTPVLPADTAVEKQCVFRVVSSASYRYARPARHVDTFVRLVPARRRGLQQLLEQKLQVAPLPQAMPETEDVWGNRIFEVRHTQVAEHLTLIVDLTLQTACRYTEQGVAVPTPIPSRRSLSEDRRVFSEFTDRTRPSVDLERVAKALQAAGDGETIAADPFAFAVRLRKFVHEEMTFTAGATHVGTVAAEAWEKRTGVCQDFTHILICLFRLSGLPARYVSGFVPGEGVMHAWAEVLLPVAGEDSSDKRSSPTAAWFAIDPTYNKWVTERYITVAVGRDYGDVTPTSGTYFGGANTLRYGTRVVAID